MTTRQETKEKRYYEILQTALEEFVKKGYYGTTTREISKKLNISSGLLFHYFESKDSLYDTLLEIGSAEMTEWIDNEKDVLQVLEDAVTHIFNQLETNPFFAKMFIFMDQAHRLPDVTEKSKVLFNMGDRVILETVPLIKKGQEENLIREGDPLSLSMAFWSSVQGIAQGKESDDKIKMPDPKWIIDIIKKN
jgi:AcrR family transcriptional regulator